MTYLTRKFGMAVLAGAVLATVGIARQHENHPGGPPPNTAPAAGCCANTSNPSAPGASCPHMQAAKLADELLASFDALEKEQDRAALKLKLAAHGTLLKQLKTTTEQKCPMMEHMGGGMMGGGMRGGMQHDAPAK